MNRNIWLMAAVVTGLVAIWEAAVVVDMVAGATVIDVAALVITGFFCGLFAGLHVTRRHHA